MDLGELRGYITGITLLTFLGICWWAYRSDNAERFERDALLPFLERDEREPEAAAESEEERS